METLQLAAAATTAKDDPTIWRVDDPFWTLLEPVLRRDEPREKPGRPRRDDRAIFGGLTWLARIAAQRSQLPRDFGPESLVHERFSEWTVSGALERARAVLLAAYDAERGLDRAW
ncbi:MAG TPA: transposase [Thermomicrobiales bacterium]|nr:transposase [Thermomicrobiales bacterium]